MTRPTEAAIITRALDLLRAGTLVSAIPNQLMGEFNLSPEKAKDLASKALKRWRGLRNPVQTS